MLWRGVRFRLTMLYVLLIGGLLLLGTMLIYLLAGVVWQGYVDKLLRETADVVLASVPPGQWDAALFEDMGLRPDVIVQRLRPTGVVAFSWPDENLDALYRGKDLLVGTHYDLVALPNQPLLRVLSIPLNVGGRPAGALQIAMPVDVPRKVQQNLLLILLLLAFLVVLIIFATGMGLSAWILRPLERLAAITLTITHADDLSIRIPEPARDDEIGQVIGAFNTTLERLERLFISQQRFLADVSHELRTPLTVISGNVGLMRRAAEYDPELLDNIETEVQRLTRMVESLLLLARAEAGKLALQKTPVALDDLLLDVMNSMQVLASGKVDLVLESIDQICVQADRDRLKQVFVNLISNAIKYTPPGGKIFVGMDREDGRVRIWVRDTGPGIPAEDLPHVFERFYRAEKARTRRGQASGFGLGLSIAYWIVKNHGGDIAVASKEKQGTVFTVLLPEWDSGNPNLPCAAA